MWLFLGWVPPVFGHRATQWQHFWCETCSFQLISSILFHNSMGCWLVFGARLSKRLRLGRGGGSPAPCFWCWRPVRSPKREPPPKKIKRNSGLGSAGKNPACARPRLREEPPGRERGRPGGGAPAPALPRPRAPAPRGGGSEHRRDRGAPVRADTGHQYGTGGAPVWVDTGHQYGMTPVQEYTRHQQGTAAGTSMGCYWAPVWDYIRHQ